MSLLDAQQQFDLYGFTNDLAIPDEIYLARRPYLVLQIRESDVQMGIYDENGDPLTTTVWGYGVGATGGYLGPTLIAEQDSPVTIKWQNQLPTTGHLLPVDYTLHRADPVLKTIEKGYVPIVTHLHGGETDAAFDGHPDAWYTQTRGPKGPAEFGPRYAGNAYTYENEQQAATLWYHDHALGLTRLNVYAGLAGFYKLTDDNKTGLITDDVLPATEIPLAIQDKAFTADGHLYYPAYKTDPLPGTDETVGDMVPQTFYDANGENAASALPEFFGDHIVVNGVAWPNLDVGRGSYAFNLLNGSDSRFYVLDFADSDPDADPTVLAVGTDGGLLPAAVELDGPFVVAPGDRVDIVVDFGTLDDGSTVRLLNSGPLFSPFKGFDETGNLIDADAASPDDPVGNIMQFTVDSSIRANTTVSVTAGTVLNPDYVDITGGPFDHVRRVGLFEGEDEYGRVQPLLGTAEEGVVHSSDMDPDGDFGPLMWDAPTTETPTVGTTEKWEIFNFTADAHPIHLHLTQYQGVGRRDIAFRDGEGAEPDEPDGVPDDTNADGRITYGHYGSEAEINYGAHDVWISETLRPLTPEEGGRQDTLYVASAEMLEIAATFEKEGAYVWHCHILSHEDHEMMRPMEVKPATEAVEIA